MFELLELGRSTGLREVFVRDLSFRDLSEGVDSPFGAGADVVCVRTGNGDMEEAGVGVHRGFGSDGEARHIGGRFGEEGEARGPLDGGLATEQSGQHGYFGFVEAACQRARAGKGEDHGIAIAVGDAFLTAIVLGLVFVDEAGDVAWWGAAQGWEEVRDPALEVGVLGAVGNDGDVGFAVGEGGVGGNRIVREVLLKGAGGGGVDGLA